MTTPFICHVEWGTPDPDVLQKFLTQLFGWGFQAFAPNYMIYLSAEGGEVGTFLIDITVDLQ